MAPASQRGGDTLTISTHCGSSDMPKVFPPPACHPSLSPSFWGLSTHRDRCWDFPPHEGRGSTPIAPPPGADVNEKASDGLWLRACLGGHALETKASLEGNGQYEGGVLRLALLNACLKGAPVDVVQELLDRGRLGRGCSLSLACTSVQIGASGLQGK